MWPSESDLEPLDSIIDQMNPIPGFPYPMKSAKNEGFPRSVGDPWIGAYTKNGYWFKLTCGGKDEWQEVANEMWYRNEFLVGGKSFEVYKKAMGEEEEEERVKLLVAKNIRGEVLGLALLSHSQSSNFSYIGPIFVQEDFRHVGIGKTLMKEVMKNQKDIAFNAISYLLPTIGRFLLDPKLMRTIGRMRVKNPSGFASLKDSKTGIILKFGHQISVESDWNKIIEFGESCTNEKRNWKAFVEDQKVTEDNEDDNNNEEERNQLVAAFDEETNTCVGICVLREIHNEDGHIPDLLVAPLYAKSTGVAEILLQKTLKKYYNSDDDYPFDIDHLAIYRRTTNFFVFSSSESLLFPLLKKLCGSEGKLEKDRLTYQTCSNFQLPAISHEMILATSDPNIYLS